MANVREVIGWLEDQDPDSEVMVGYGNDDGSSSHVKFAFAPVNLDYCVAHRPGEDGVAMVYLETGL